MKAKDVIKALQQVNPETDVTVTAHNGTEIIARIITSGYNDPVTILTE